MKKFQKLKKQSIRIGLFLFVHMFVLLPDAFAAKDTEEAIKAGTSNLKNKTLQQLVADFILLASEYVLTILVGLTVFVFLYGLMKYMFKGQGSDTARSEGRKLMLWGIIGIFVITSVWGIVAIFASFLGHGNVFIPQFK